MRRIASYHGRAPRCPNHDQRLGGWYFVTIKTEGRVLMLGQVRDRALCRTPEGDIVAEEWLRTGELRAGVTLGPWVVMPDHFHALLEVKRSATVLVEAPRLHRHPRSIASIVACFKAASTGRINRLHGTPRRRIWQSNYYDRVIRDEQGWQAVARYIENNPRRLIEKVAGGSNSGQGI